MFLPVGDKMNAKNCSFRIVVLECLKDPAFDSVCLRLFVIMPLARSVVKC